MGSYAENLVQVGKWLDRYPIYWEFLETYDEYFPYRTEKGVMLGDWNIYGIGLDDEILHKVYHENAERLLNISVCR